MRPVPFHAGIGLVLAGGLVAIVAALTLGFLFPASAADVATLAGAQAAGVVAALALGIRVYEPGVDLRTAVRFEPVTSPVAALSLLLGLSMYVPLTEMGNAAQLVVPMSDRELATFRQVLEPSGAGRALVALLATVVVAPLTEEAFFRGFLLRGLRRAHGPRIALLVTSVLFAAAHASVWRAPGAFVAGVAFGALSLASRSTVAPLLAHAACNAAPFVVPARLVAVPGVNVVGATPRHAPLVLVVATTAVALAAAVALALVLRRARRPEDAR